MRCRIASGVTAAGLIRSNILQFHGEAATRFFPHQNGLMIPKRENTIFEVTGACCVGQFEIIDREYPGRIPTNIATVLFNVDLENGDVEMSPIRTVEIAESGKIEVEILDTENVDRFVQKIGVGLNIVHMDTICLVETFFTIAYQDGNLALKKLKPEVLRPHAERQGWWVKAA